jgi:alkylation response protein AidB-like acyl-CoA dehydrogenase
MATPHGFDAEVWRRLCEDLALGGVHIPEEYGGQGFGFQELAVVAEEMGRALLCAPYFSSTVLAATAILNAGSEADKAELLPRIASGERRAALAVTEPNGRWDAGGIESTAVGNRLSGTKSFVVDGHSADLLVVVARQHGTQSLGFYAVEATAPGVSRRLLTALDATRKLARIEFAAAPARAIGTDNAASALEHTLDLAAVALANEMVGGAQALLESAVAYADLRLQFGRPIGSFQAVKHRCADLLLDVELAKSAAYQAAHAAATDDAELPALASLAKAAASDAYIRAAKDCIQIHGGIGFTWDNDTHLWYKRAKSAEAFLGSAAEHRERLMDQWRTPQPEVVPAQGPTPIATAEDSAEAHQLREEVRRWLAEHWDPDLSLVAWREQLADSGWGMPVWPKAWFGRDLPQALEVFEDFVVEVLR